MKKAFLLTAFLLMICLLAVSACKSVDPPINDSSSLQTNLGTGDNNADIPSVCNHTFGEWNTVKQANCKDEGKRERACTQCNETEVEAIEKSTVHTPTIDASFPATCKTYGLTEGSHCSVCDEVLVKQTVIPRLEHTVIIDEAVTATCTNIGLTEGSHCSACKSILIKQVEIPMLAHTFVDGICHCGAKPELLMQLSDDGSYYTVSGIGTYIDTVVIIPDTYKNKPVKAIGGSAFNGNQSITHIVLGSQITEIGPWAFYQCANLTGVTTSSIGSWCNIRFENSYSNPLFYGKNLYVGDTLVTDLIIPDEIKSINDFSFECCTSIKTASLGENVEKIGSNAFHSCTELSDIKLNGKLQIISDYAFFNCSKLTTDLYFADTLTEIGECAFANVSSLPSVYFGSSLKSIGYAAFRNCVKLESLIIPITTELIGKYAFQNCSNVDSVIFQAPCGWKCSHSSYPTSNMGEEALSYPSGAAEFLTDAYADREWTHIS